MKVEQVHMHAFRFKVSGEFSNKHKFYDHPSANDMYKYRGDMWKYIIENIYPDTSCIQFGSMAFALKHSLLTAGK